MKFGYSIGAQLGLVICTALLTTAAPSTFAQPVDELTFLTEQYPPYNFRQEGRLQGISLELLEFTLERLGSNLKRDQFTLVP